jgi:hypothetical protein
MTNCFLSEARAMRKISNGLSLAILLYAGPAMALDPRYPDWPCQQLKVPEISVASVWNGPPIADLERSRSDDPKIADVIARLAARRTPMDEAKKLIADFVTGPAEVRQARAVTLFAGLFSTLNGQRSDVMSGIERFSHKEKEMAEDIRDKTRKMQASQDQPGGDQAEADKLADQLTWETRIFEDRKLSLSYVCEVPTLIEKRLFDLSHLIQDAANVTPAAQ